MTSDGEMETTTFPSCSRALLQFLEYHTLHPDYSLSISHNMIPIRTSHRVLSTRHIALNLTSQQTRTFSLFGWLTDSKPTKPSQLPQQTSASTVTTNQTQQHQPLKQEEPHKDLSTAEDKMKAHQKTWQERDEELKAKMAGLSGDGGDAGVEYEDGQPVAMKRRYVAYSMSQVWMLNGEEANIGFVTVLRTTCSGIFEVQADFLCDACDCNRTSESRRISSHTNAL